MPQKDQSDLVTRLVGMDDAAWREFTALYHRPLLASVAARFDCGHELAGEVVQMTFVKCVRAMKTYRPEKGGLLQWLSAVAANEARTLLRKRGRLREMPLSNVPQQIADKICSALDSAPLPDDILAREDVRAAVRDSLCSLKDHYARALSMKYVDDLSVAEIALAMDTSEKAAESLLSRAREAMRNEVTHRFDGAPPRAPGRSS